MVKIINALGIPDTTGCRAFLAPGRGRTPLGCGFAACGTCGFEGREEDFSHGCGGWSRCDPRVGL